VFFQGPQSRTSIGSRSNSGSFCTCNGDGISSLVARYSFEGHLSGRLRPSSGVTSSSPGGLLRWLFSQPKRSSAGHTRGDNRRRSRSNNYSLSTFVPRDIRKGFRSSIFAERTTWTGGFLFHRNTRTKGSGFRGAGNDIRFNVCGRERPSLERGSRSFGPANSRWVRSSRLSVPHLRRCGILECSQNGEIY
jgi:hypothetical protein